MDLEPAMLSVRNKRAIALVAGRNPAWFLHVVDISHTISNRVPYKGDIMSCGKKFVKVISVKEYQNVDSIPENIISVVDSIPEMPDRCTILAVRVITLW